jgi:hypothetical protein
MKGALGGVGGAFGGHIGVVCGHEKRSFTSGLVIRLNLHTGGEAEDHHTKMNGIEEIDRSVLYHRDLLWKSAN